MRTVTTIGAMLVLAGCTALPIDMNKVASEVGVDQSSISLAHSCTYAESAPGVGIADFSNAMCVVLTDRITLLKSDWLGQTHGGSPLTMRFDELEGVALVFFLQSAQLQLQYRGRLVVLKLNVDREAIKYVDASIKAAGVKAFEGSYVWNQ